MPEINLGLAASLLDKIRYNTGVARGSLTSQGTKAPDPALRWFSRNNFKKASAAFSGGSSSGGSSSDGSSSGGSWAVSSLNPADAEPAYPQANFQQSQYTVATNSLTVQGEVTYESTTKSPELTRYQAIVDTYIPGRYRDEPNASSRRIVSSRGTVFGLVRFYDYQLPEINKISSKAWELGHNHVRDPEVQKELAVVYMYITYASLDYLEEYHGVPLRDEVKLTLQSLVDFVSAGGTLAVGSEWFDFFENFDLLASDINEIFGTSIRDNKAAKYSSTTSPSSDVLVPKVFTSNQEPFRAYVPDYETTFSGGSSIFSDVVVYENVGAGKIVRFSGAQTSGGLPLLYDGEEMPSGRSKPYSIPMPSSFGTSLVAWTLGVPYEEIGDLKID